MAAVHDVRLKGVKEVDNEDFEGKNPYELFANLPKAFAERQTDGSHDDAEILIKKMRGMLRNAPINYMIALETGDIAYTIFAKFPIRQHHVI